jgi:phosphatidylglycerophosphatase C
LPIVERRVAAFDFDGTLTRRDTLLPFLVRSCGARAVARSVSRVAPTAARARLGRLEGELHHRDAVKESLLADLLAGREAAWLADAGRSYAATLPRRLRPEMVGQLDWHRSEGHELIIVSAGLLAYLEPYGQAEGFDHVIAVGMEEGPDGRLTGRLTGPNVRGPEKAVRFADWFGPGRPEHLWAYGNSSGDLELLQLADSRVWVSGPDRTA